MRSSFELRFAKYTDKENIMSFIKKYWANDHILSHDHLFFDFQYRIKDDLQFVLALDHNNKIVGLLGYIQYDSEENEQDIALALWRVIPNLSDPILGIKLFEYLRNNLKHRSIFCVGINKKTIGVYKFMGFKTDKLLHFAAFNPVCRTFSIAIPPLNKKNLVCDDFWDFKKIKPFNLSLEKLIKFTTYKNKKPYKSKNYILKRYVKHPYFIYTFFEVYKKNIYIGLVVSREVQYFNSKALRIIDVLAEDGNISSIINEFVILLKKSYQDYEYVDVYASNLDKSLLMKGNYELISDSQKITIPDYFSPFKQKNIDIYFFTSNNRFGCLFKGDGDQDSPRTSLIKND